MTVRWTAGAVADLETISDYISEDKPDAALKTVRRIFARIEELRRFPLLGRKGREPGTRELIVASLPYIVAYRVRGEAIEVVRIHHGAQLAGRPNAQ